MEKSCEVRETNQNKTKTKKNSRVRCPCSFLGGGRKVTLVQIKVELKVIQSVVLVFGEGV